MNTSPPAEIGMPIEEVDTPALLLNLDVFERNLDRMANAMVGKSVKLRPQLAFFRIVLKNPTAFLQKIVIEKTIFIPLNIRVHGVRQKEF